MLPRGGDATSGQEHGADDVAAPHRAERVVPAVERRSARDHRSEVELAVERPLREPREVLLRQMVAAVGDEDARALRRTAAGRSSVAPSRPPARGRSGRRSRRSRSGRAPARTSRAGRRRRRRSRPARARCASRRTASPARACARRGRARGSRTRRRCARPGSTDSPTAPQPITATRAPSQTFAVSSTDMTPVATAQPIRHACSTGSSRGTLHRGDGRNDRVRRERARSEHRRQLRAVVTVQPARRGGRLLALPRLAPRAHRAACRMRPSSRARTRSPCCSCTATSPPSPTATTVPAPSCPSRTGNGWCHPSSSITCRSL